MFRFLGQKYLMFDFDVLLFTRIRMQRWHVNSLGIVLSETVSLSAHTTLSRPESHQVTDDATHQQTQLLMLVISRWLHVWRAAVDIR